MAPGLDERHLGAIGHAGVGAGVLRIGGTNPRQWIRRGLRGRAGLRRNRSPCGHLGATQVSNAAGQVLELVVFAIFGGYAIFTGWREIDWRTVLFCVAVLVLVRPVAVQLALLGTDVPMRSRWFIGWFGRAGSARWYSACWCWATAPSRTPRSSPKRW